MTIDGLSDAKIAALLRGAKRIAMVGASANPDRPSFGVMAFLLAHGHEVAPVNPGLAGQTLQGRTVHARLADVPGPIDLVDVFRNSALAGAVVDEALALTPRPGAVWMQLGVVDEAAAARARAKGVEVVMDRCPKIEYGRLRLA
ncbi:MAG: CoA-binding protein [Hyphomicrobiales bacterium]|nr:CoA-binding protein [Hyphomicrobiales bacterium]